MNKELEEAIKFLKLHSDYNGIVDRGQCIRIPEENFTKTKQSIATVLQALENSIPKEVIESELKYKENKLRQLDNDRYRKMCLQIEIDLLQKLLEGEQYGKRKNNRIIKKRRYKICKWNNNQT